MRQQLSLLFLIAGFQIMNAQLPETDVWLFKLNKDKLSNLSLSEPMNLSNRAGYDNQPSFSKDGKMIYYVSVREDKQADVYSYKISGKKLLRLTNTPESEYSPIQTDDGRFITSVVVEKDSAQRIHFINSESGMHEKSLEMDSVGYYEFINADTVVYYKLTQPHSLRFFVNSTKEEGFLGSSPVRAFKALNRHTLLFGLKDSSSVSYYKYDFFLRKAIPYCTYQGLHEDFIWHPEYGMIKSEDAKLLRYNEANKQWLPLFDFSAFGIKKITRFAFDPKNKYVLVVENK